MAKSLGPVKRKFSPWTDPAAVPFIRFENITKRFGDFVAVKNLTLDIYDPHCPDQPPYSKAFVARFRAAQLARNRRITTNALNLLHYLKDKNDGEMERGFVVHRTNCDVRWIDPTVDPNGRKPGWCFLGDPRIANSAPAGLARFSSLRSWLSQWSVDHTNARGVMNAARTVYSKSLSHEVARDGVTVNTIGPGVILSEQINEIFPTQDAREDYCNRHIPVGYFGEPRDLAVLVAFLASPVARYITGEVIAVDGGSHRFAF